MFKGKLIDGREYHLLKRNAMILGLAVIFIQGFAINMFKLQFGWQVIITTLFVLAMIYFILVNRKIIRLIRNRKVEIGSKWVRVFDRTGRLLEQLDLDDTAVITLPSEFVLPGEKTRDLWRQLMGEIQSNTVVIKQNGEEHIYDLVIESYYMLEQLRKLRESWEASGFRVKIIPSGEMQSSVG